MGKGNRRDQNAAVEAALRGARFTAKWIRVECPFCADLGHRDRKRSLGVHAATGRYHCFRCGEWGFLDEAPDPSASYEDADREEPEVTTMEPPEDYYPLWKDPGLTAETFKEARRYLKKRFVTRKMMEELQIGACADGWYAGRVIVPMLDLSGGWLGWSARIWRKLPPGSDVLPYLYPKGMPRGFFLWNHRAIFEETDRPLLVVEGVFDATPYYPDVVATLGKPAHSHIEILLEATRPVVFVPDGDAWEGGWTHAMRLRFEGKSAGFVKLGPKKDPDEVDRDWVWKEARRSLNRRDL